MLSQAHKEAIRKTILAQDPDTKKTPYDNFFHYTDEREPISKGKLVIIKVDQSFRSKGEEWVVFIIGDDTYIYEKGNCVELSDNMEGDGVARILISSCTRVAYHFLLDQMIEFKQKADTVDTLKEMVTELEEDNKALKLVITTRNDTITLHNNTITLHNKIIDGDTRRLYKMEEERAILRMEIADLKRKRVDDISNHDIDHPVMNIPTKR